VSKYFRFFLVWVIHFSNGWLCFSQPVASPNLKCLSVSSVGDVTLNWTTPADPAGNFTDYRIYSSLAFTGPYTLVTTITTYTQTSFTHIGANGNSGRIYYRIQTDSKPGPALSTPLDTFSTIFLTVSGSTKAILSWNKISVHPVSSTTGWYKIFREYPLGTWSLRDSTKNLSYSDEIDICNKTGGIISYRIQADDNTGCTSVSNTAGKIFTDQTPPILSPIDSVSVDPVTNQATISWKPSPSPDADSIVIYQAPGVNGQWITIASVPVPVTFYKNTLSKASNLSEFYRIAFKDSCGNISPLGTYHKTIHLSSSFDICASTARLSWNKYINWNPGVSQYKILKSTNGGPLTLIATTGALDTTYIDTGLILGTSYCYIIRATNGTRTSSSNKVCFLANVVKPPQFTYNRFATVLSPTSVLIKAHVDFSLSVKYYRIQRALRTSGNFSIIAPVVLPSPGGVLTYIDNSVNTGTSSYNYKIEAMDSCRHVIMASNLDTTMLLIASIADNLNINLIWNDYGNWIGKVDHYDVYRSVDGIWGPSPVASVPFKGKGGAYIDDVSPFFINGSRGVFSYYIKAIEGSGNTFSFVDSSRSNIALVNEYPNSRIPNTFTPNGDNLNDMFIPLVGFIDTNNYSLMIFDNTGTPCFETHDPTAGWDGKKNGHPCMEGVYMYLIKCKASNGNDSKISGTLSLYR
jgi:gliding motility-associated-like protein